MITAEINVKPYNASLQKLALHFHSGNDYLDNFLRSTDALNPSYGKTFVWVDEEETEIVGYYNIGTGSIDEIEAGKRIKIGGCVHINALAMDVGYRGALQVKAPDGKDLYLSDYLLSECIRRIYEMRDTYVGCAYITLCSTKEGYGLYKRAEFEELEEGIEFSVEDQAEPFANMYLWLE